MSRPAFYALTPGGWRDWVTILHLPYTAWHLSYALVGGCLVATVDWGVLGLTVLAFFLAMGIGAHALDELHGRPLGTTVSAAGLVVAATVSVTIACAIGVGVALADTLWLLPLIALGAVLVPAYNLEWLGGRLHTDLVFALSWGAFPVVTAFVAQAGALRAEAVLAALWALFLSLAQRRLSATARRLRRNVVDVSGRLVHSDGLHEPVDRAALLSVPESALKLLTVSTIAIALSLTVLRL